MEREKIPTSFITIYDSFLARVTDDMYMEMTEIETIEALQDILINAIPRFEFPRVDLFDYEGNQSIKIKDALDAMKSMRFDVRNPDLYDIVKKMSETKDIVTWPFFASFINDRLTARKTDFGLRTIFDLFIDNPDKESITFDTFKKICRDIGETISEDEMKNVLQNATENGDQISFKDFCKYMRITQEK